MAEKSKSGRSSSSRGARSKSESKGEKQKTANRGFATMDEEKQREISSKGGGASKGGGHRS